ncbi:unnamed protein product [Rotaria sp. Silwood1]|nr:unnamed protein product [Rotaria sp. Silwood1]
MEIPKRYVSFATWPSEQLPAVDDLVRAGFFYTGKNTIVTCFYCNGSLQNWGSNDNPMIEHARWFPHCAYAKQLCGDDLYRKIQESKRLAQDCDNNRVMRWSKDTKQGTVPVSGNNQDEQLNQFYFPQDLSFDRHSNLYIVDYANARIQRFNIGSSSS